MLFLCRTPLRFTRLTRPAIRKLQPGERITDRHKVGQDVLTREQLVDQLSEGDPTRRKLAERLLSAPRSFEEGANDSTKKLAKSVG